MIPPDLKHTREHENWQFQFARDTCDRVIPIPTGEDLEGYLVRDNDHTTFAQVRFLMTEDPEKRRAFKTVWKNFNGRADCTFFPEILSLDLSAEIPFYVSKLPIGEPIVSYLERTGTILPEVAARLVLGFVETLLDHRLRFYKKYAISPNSIWMEKTSAQPRLVLGELAPAPDLEANAEAANTGLCVLLLQYLSGMPEKNQDFLTLCNEIERGPQKLHVLASSLANYTTVHLPGNFWTDYNQPIPVLQQHDSIEVETETSPNLIRRIPSGLKALAACWPIFAGAAAILMIFQTIALTFFPTEDESLSFETYDTFEIIDQPPIQKRPVQVRSTPSPTSPVVLPAPSSASPPRVVHASQPVGTAHSPIVRSYGPPLPPAPQPKVKFRVAYGSRSDSVLYRPRPFNVQTVKIGSLNSRSDLSLQTREVIQYLKNRMGQTSSNSSPNNNPGFRNWDEPEEEKLLPAGNLSKEQRNNEVRLQVLHLVKAAREARTNDQRLEAIQNEVDLLKIIPKSSDAKLRLYNDLLNLKHSTGPITSPGHIETLEEASYFHPMAIDILMKVFHGVANRGN